MTISGQPCTGQSRSRRADVGARQIGLGLAVAALIDATAVRLVLVPARPPRARIRAGGSDQPRWPAR